MLLTSDRQTLPTLGGRSSFDYTGSIKEGTTLWYGKHKRNRAWVSAEEWAALMQHFNGRTVLVGNGRRHRPKHSLGLWLQEHVSRAVIAAYLAQIIITEGYGEKRNGPSIHIWPIG